jgi:hypothetical protein
MEVKTQISSTSHYLGLSIEKFDVNTGSTLRNKYECRVEYKVPLGLWRQVSDITGSIGGQFNMTLSNFLNNNLPVNQGTAGLVGPQENNWTPVKMICDLNRMVPDPFSNISSKPTTKLGSLRVGSVYQQLISGSAVYQYSQTTSHGLVNPNYIKFEIHIGNDTPGAWGDFFFNDLIITREPSI